MAVVKKIICITAVNVNQAFLITFSEMLPNHALLLVSGGGGTAFISYLKFQAFFVGVFLGLHAGSRDDQSFKFIKKFHEAKSPTA